MSNSKEPIEVIVDLVDIYIEDVKYYYFKCGKCDRVYHRFKWLKGHLDRKHHPYDWISVRYKRE